MNVTVLPSHLSGTVEAPPSKSYAHRLLIASALAGDGMVRGIAMSEDIAATLDCIAALGVGFRQSGDTVCFSGKVNAKGVLNCRESGSTLRFFMPVALLFGKPVTFTGAPRLIERGIGIYETLLSARGINFCKTPTEITACGQLTAGEYTIPGDISSQFASGLLFALPLCTEDSTLKILAPVESRSYIDITLDVLRSFGIVIEEKAQNLFYIRGNQTYRAGNHTVEGDWSNAAALLGFNWIGGDVRLTGLNHDSKQGDKVCEKYFECLKEKNATIDLADCPDLAPVLFATAAAVGNGVTFLNTRRLRIKESDRAAVMAEELAKFGVSCHVAENSVVIAPGTLQKPAMLLQSHNDHRIVMALTLLASRTGGTIVGAQAVAKSYPDYFSVLKTLGAEVTYETE